MSPSTCASPLDLATLLDHWLWEPSEAPRPDVEEHLLGCDTCSGELARLVALGDGIRDVVRQGGVRAIVSPAFLDRVTAEGLRLREYRVAPGGSVECSVAPEDDVLVSRLVVDPPDAGQVDLVWIAADGTELERLRDIPARGTREIVWVQDMAQIRALPKSTLHARLVAVDASGERLLAEYTFNHTPAS